MVEMTSAEWFSLLLQLHLQFETNETITCKLQPEASCLIETIFQFACKKRSFTFVWQMANTF